MPVRWYGSVRANGKVYQVLACDLHARAVEDLRPATNRVGLTSSIWPHRPVTVG